MRGYTNRGTATLALAAAALFACGKHNDFAPPDAAAAVSVQPLPLPSPAPQVAAKPIADSELQALLARWTEAQNKGDFAAYQQLYAQRFLGIKRAGERTTSFTREPWLEDRKRMFQKPMQVQALEPVLRAAADSAELSFQQRWASGTFADEGAKRLLVVREAGTLKIAHEEMLSSALLSPERAAAVAFDFHFTIALDSGLYMPLPEARVPINHGAIASESESDHDAAGNVYTSSAQVEESTLAPDVLAWKGNRVRLDDGCVASVVGFVLLSRVEPHFGTLQQWQGSGDSVHPPLAPAQVAEAAFALTDPVVAARLQGCHKGTFAQRAQTPVPMLATFVEDPSLVPKARAAFAKLKSVKSLQTRHAREAEDPSGLWWEPSLKLQSFRHPLSGQTLVSVSADNGGICADFAASEWALFELRAGKLVHLYSGAPPQTIEQVLDVNADGRLELIVTQQSFDSDRALVSPDTTGPRTELRHSFQDCPC